MKKLLLVIDDTLQEYDVAAFKVSSGEYDDYDTVIMIDTVEKSVEAPYHEPLQYVAEGVNRPSKEGISSVPYEKRPLQDILSHEQLEELKIMRDEKKIIILPQRLMVKDHRRIQKKFVIHTKKYDILAPNSLESAIAEMVAIEDLKLKGKLLYLVQEPVMIPKANNTFYLQEIVDVYGPQEEVSNVTKESSAGAKSSGVSQGPDSQGRFEGADGRI
jgi:hypothetical protein